MFTYNLPLIQVIAKNLEGIFGGKKTTAVDWATIDEESARVDEMLASRKR